MIKLHTEQPKIIVVGSSSIDLVINTEKYPKPDETIMASKTESFFGGKGANQAVGTARLGASVYFVSCVGMDPMGQQIMRNLKEQGINVAFVGESENTETGTAYVTAADNKNAIVVVPAANYDLTPKHIDNAEKFFDTADMILIQLEIPMQVVEHTIRLAKKYQVPVGIYASPAAKLSEEIIDYATFIVAKNEELPVIFGTEDTEALYQRFPNKLLGRDNANCTTYFNGEEMKKFGQEDIQTTYKMGMGDAFTSGFAIAYCHKNPVEDCVKFGNRISLEVSKVRGSQRGLPLLKDLNISNEN